MSNLTDIPTIRHAGKTDLEAIVAIYNHYVSGTHCTFDTVEFTPESRKPWFETFAVTGPHRLLVAELRGAVIGYACSAQFKPKPAYRTSVETTIYLDPAHLGHGFGPRLYAALLDLLERETTVHRVDAGIAQPNPESTALHERLGFTRVATFHEVGFKFGKYWDVSWYEKEV